MSAFNVACLLLFPGLGLVAIAIGLLARRFSTAALVIGLTGLLALASASTWITIAGPMTDTTQIQGLAGDNAELRKALARRNEELENARRLAHESAAKMEPHVSPKVEIERLVGELRTEQDKRVEAQRRIADANERAANEAAKVAQLEAEVREALKGKSGAERTVELLQDRLRKVEPSPPPPSLPDLPSIRRKLTDGNWPYYATQEERELIPGRKGGWYVVRLLKAGGEWNFADRQFVFPDATEIIASAVRLRDDVLYPLSKAGQRWRLFVRGAADPRPVAGPVGRDLFFLPRLSDGTYALDLSVKQVTLPVRNEELPALRADWLRDIVRPLLGDASMADIEILENPPKLGHGRTAELVLFVEW